MPSAKSTSSEEEKHVELLQRSESHGQVNATSKGDDTASSTGISETAGEPAKDGGTRAWLQVAGSFLVFAK